MSTEISQFPKYIVFYVSIINEKDLIGKLLPIFLDIDFFLNCIFFL